MTNISPTGFWVLLDGRELFLPFADFPWFRSATVGQITNVRRPSPHHLHWPDLDVDLAMDSIEHPRAFSLGQPGNAPAGSPAGRWRKGSGEGKEAGPGSGWKWPRCLGARGPGGPKLLADAGGLLYQF